MNTGIEKFELANVDFQNFKVGWSLHLNINKDTLLKFQGTYLSLELYECRPQNNDIKFIKIDTLEITDEFDNEIIISSKKLIKDDYLEYKFLYFVKILSNEIEVEKTNTFLVDLNSIFPLANLILSPNEFYDDNKNFLTFGCTFNDDDISSGLFLWTLKLLVYKYDFKKNEKTFVDCVSFNGERITEVSLRKNTFDEKYEKLIIYSMDVFGRVSNKPVVLEILEEVNLHDYR